MNMNTREFIDTTMNPIIDDLTMALKTGKEYRAVLKRPLWTSEEKRTISVLGKRLIDLLARISIQSNLVIDDYEDYKLEELFDIYTQGE